MFIPQYKVNIELPKEQIQYKVFPHLKQNALNRWNRKNHQFCMIQNNIIVSPKPLNTL